MRRGAVRAFFSERRGGRSMMRSAIPYHPVCANKAREHFLSGAATPPNLGGEFGLTFRYMTYQWAKRELEEFGKMSKLQSRAVARVLSADDIVTVLSETQ